MAPLHLSLPSYGQKVAVKVRTFWCITIRDLGILEFGLLGTWTSESLFLTLVTADNDDAWGCRPLPWKRYRGSLSPNQHWCFCHGCARPVPFFVQWFLSPCQAKFFGSSRNQSWPPSRDVHASGEVSVIVTLRWRMRFSWPRIMLRFVHLVMALSDRGQEEVQWSSRWNLALRSHLWLSVPRGDLGGGCPLTATLLVLQG